MKRYLFILWLLSCFSLKAQKEANNWYFGDQAGITFNTNPPSAITNGKMYSDEGCASISASNGRLLFYTNGINVWDSTHKVMPNGSGLKGNSTSTQSAIIVPKPDNPQIYYIFTVAPEGISDGLQYSELNMNLNSGKGDIVSGKKNIKLKSPVCEKITAVQKKNLNEYWVLTAKFKSDSFFAYSVTNAGVNFTPIGYTTGFKIFGNGTNAIGYLKVSADSKKIAYANGTFDTAVIGDFDAVTGKISKLWKFYCKKGYGIEFSPKSKYLYMSEEGTKKIFQYDLTSNSLSAFIASKKIVDSGYNFSPAALQIGPDGKIYISSVNDQYLSVIQSPDSNYCNPQKNYVYLSSRYAHYGLPSFIKRFFQDTDFVVKSNCINDSTSFKASFDYDLDSVKWNFDDPGSGLKNSYDQLENAYHIYKKNGRYKVSLITYRNNIKRTYLINAVIYNRLKPNLGKDTSICNSFKLSLQPQKNYLTYFWTFNSSTAKSLTVSQEGTYILNVKDSGECWMADTLQIFNPQIKAQFKSSDTVQCLEGNSFKFTNTSFYKNNYRLKSNFYFGDGTFLEDTIVNKSYLQAGNYNIKLIIESNTHCKDSIIKAITVFTKGNVFIGKDTVFCGNFTHVLKTNTPFAKYNWSTGESSIKITIYKKGTYFVTVTDNNNCTLSDSIEIDNIIVPKHKIKISYDSVNCQYVYLSFDSLSGLTYSWNTGQNTQGISVINKGWYALTEQFQFCSNVDSILVNKLANPVLDLGPDTNLCLNTIKLVPNETGAYLWNTLETKSWLVIDKPGKYWLTVSRNNCSATDTVVIQICEEMVYYVPDIFSPNGDHINDMFNIYCENIEYISMEIFNRWGEKMFDSFGKTASWDGTYKNEICSEDIYFYKVMIKGNKLGKVVYLKGSITLIK